MSVGRICVREVDLAAADETVPSAARRIVERDVGTLVIVNETKHPIGVITDRDLVRRVLAPGKGPQHTHVGEVMTRDPKVIGEDSPIDTALAVMRVRSVGTHSQRSSPKSPQVIVSAIECEGLTHEA